jgi:16S rRNA A1518/A1519 N6-dimethyltransferase RsmA/KsgA/DIM1 with predicted DNA glycosylase/AP lyase activity
MGLLRITRIGSRALFFDVAGKQYNPYHYVKRAVKFRKWKFRKQGNDYVVVHDGQVMLLSRYHCAAAVSEYYTQWSYDYIPTGFSLKGLTVLDVGAGYGETAHLFLENGAARVIAIESDSLACQNLRQTIEVNDWPVEVIAEPFKLEHLKLKFDICKMDIEGGEAELLKLDALPFPISIEVHSEELKKQFEEKFNLHRGVSVTIRRNF